jgi:ribonuclease BN (tRNA processing enzyme)
MRLTVLGSGTAIPSPVRGSPALLLAAGGRNVLVDCGPGSLRRAAAAGVAPGDIDAVILTHFHHDHTTDLRSLLFALSNPAYAGRGPLSVVGPAGLERLLGQWFDADDGDWLRPRDYSLEVTEIGPGRHAIPGFSVEAVSVEHTPVSLAYRFREPKGHAVIAVSGDTAQCDGVVAAGSGADLFVLECAFPDDGLVGRHLTPRRAAEVAAAARPGLLLLTHFYPEVEKEPIEEIVARTWPGEVRRAVDGLTYEVTQEGVARIPC